MALEDACFNMYTPYEEVYIYFDFYLFAKLHIDIEVCEWLKFKNTAIQAFSAIQSCSKMADIVDSWKTIKSYNFAYIT